jgi:hypothetical protein
MTLKIVSEIVAVGYAKLGIGTGIQVTWFMQQPE